MAAPWCSYLLFLDPRLLLYACEDLGHVGLEHHAAHDQLGQDEMDLAHRPDERCRLVKLCLDLHFNELRALLLLRRINTIYALT